ncbi:hypothetical protein Ahy_B08g089754 [Arachis hypogaea]|uniref:Ubiquitin-like protease family profile domain-containing protein n=1 Tax=Arachis hypogaea TaxID=3818 RepID=A0A444XYQ3_ARAHY|nr:hypothetical protein Ahy_B08g089754 [Arachis hypogaea]
MMIANTASYVPKQFLAPSFSLSFTDSSKEETLTQEGQPGSEKGKSPKTPILIEELEELVEKIANTEVKAALNFAKDKIVTAMCLILNQQNIRRFEENMAIGNHKGGEFLQPKTKKSFKIEDYKMFIPFLDLKKLASHPYIFAPVCYAEHWWIWVADVRKKKFCILDPYHKTCPSEHRMNLNKFVDLGVVLLKIRCRVCDFHNKGICREEPLKKDDPEIQPPYINISGQKTEYKSFSLKIIFFLAVAEVDHFRVEYALQILFHEMNRDRDTTIRESEAIRLSKPSAMSLSPYCQINSDDIDSD